MSIKTASTSRALHLCIAATVVGMGALFGRGASAGTESFRESCYQVQTAWVNGHTVIQASCLTGPGMSRKWATLVVPAGGCIDVENRYGELLCRRRAMPTGSWSDSCTDGYWSGPTFLAVCKNRHGWTSPTSIDINVCRGGHALQNVNGSLQCM